ncbi:MAG: MFS transporter [Deltaproteobacteria bacterium]|nr:MFS transporter [Deltaproteobacteria bacterium]
MSHFKRWWQPRFTVLALAWLVYGCFYLNRLNLSPVIPLIVEDLKISYAQIGLISTFFFAFYSAAQFPAGYLSDILGPRKIITLGGSISALANFLFGAGSGLFYLIGFQSLNGLGQGGGWGPSVKLLNNWFPPSERARALGIYCTCVSIFSVITYALAGYLGKIFGWRAAFWSVPIILLLALFIYWAVVADYPDEKSAQGFQYNTLEAAKNPFENRNRLITVLSNTDVRKTFVGFFCITYISYCNLVWLPTYLYESYGISVVAAGFLASTYPIVGIVARPLGGYLSDVTFGGRRKPLLVIGLFFIFLASFFLAYANWLVWAMILIVSIGFFEQLIISLFFALELDLLPAELAGTGAGFLDGGGHLGSMCAMFFTGFLVDWFGSFKPVFLTLSMIAAGGVVAVLLIRGKE